MTFHFFTPKILGSLLIGGGLLGTGGIIYWYRMPRTWRDLLSKEGFVFLSDEYDYKGMWNDQKDSEDWRQTDELNKATGDDVKDKAGIYCNKLKGDLPGSSDPNYESTKRKLIAFCTYGGIKTVKGKLIQSKKFGWINDSVGDKWKVVFAIYRYDSRFINWLKEASGDNNLSEKSNVSEYTKLETACSNLLVKPYGELVDNRYFDYASWWCTDLGYTTVQERIQKDGSWSREENGEAIKNRWKDTEKITGQIKTDLGKSDSGELQDSDYKKWCDDQLNKGLKENEIYKDKYLMIKSVCRKST